MAVMARLLFVFLGKNHFRIIAPSLSCALISDRAKSKRQVAPESPITGTAEKGFFPWTT